LAQTSLAKGAAPARAWPVLRSFAGWRWTDIGPDLVTGLTLAAIAVPEQMATARLAGLGPQVGFLALAAGAVGFALFGANRWISVGADSTIAPIFAGGLASIAGAGAANYAGLASLLALMVGIILVAIGLSLGLPLAFVSTRVIASQLFGLSAVDPLTFTVVTLLLVCVALVACFIPARRAMRVDPMVALRHE